MPVHRPTRRSRRALRRTATTAAALLATAAAVAPGAQAAGATYVALGDSVSSGEGSTPYLAGSNTVMPYNLCHRSTKGFPGLIAKAKGYSPDGAPKAGTFSFPACSGAATHDLFAPNDSYPEPPQFSALGTDTKLVTLTIGANDIGGVTWLSKCINIAPQWFGLPGPPTNQPGVWGCSSSNALMIKQTKLVLDALGGANNGAVLRTGEPSAADPTLGEPKLDDNGDPMPIHSLSSVLAEIHARAPQAKIVFGGYANAFGTDKSRWTRNPFNTVSGYMCDVTPPMAMTYDYLDATTGTAPDYMGANAVAARLANIQKNAVTQAVAAGINAKFFDPNPAFAGRLNCDTKTVSSNGATLDSEKWLAGISPTITGSFHPTEKGQAGYATALLATPGT